ncbi:hypothetical protein SADUNF_Sadunf02G0091200 [Salix dunnii]|uniref:non-specific serine/threonine protein kinase n=1 Tax=Salix dunnii TaxID=1413687 RepID=A0A835N6Y3_9ROSI|nr:hypothetical protein SADUNF_Sadunf02G0091200 [Salix dunnii]
MQRITVEQIRNDEWFKKGFVPVRLVEYEDVNLDDVNAVFDDPEEQRADEQHGNEEMSPLILNAFDLITLSQGLNLSTLFDRGQDSLKHQTRFVSKKPANVILSSMEVVAQSMGFKTHIRNFKMRVEGLSADKAGHFSVFEVAPAFLMVDIQRTAGDAAEYLKVSCLEIISIQFAFIRVYSTRTSVAISRISFGNRPLSRANLESPSQRAKGADFVSWFIMLQGALEAFHVRVAQPTYMKRIYKKSQTAGKKNKGCNPTQPYGDAKEEHGNLHKTLSVNQIMKPLSVFNKDDFSTGQ